MFYTLQRLMKEDVTYDYIMLLQPTQPLRKAEFLEEAIELIIDNDHPSLVSVSPVLEHPILMRTVDKTGALCSLLSTSSTVRRQDFSPVYKVNGSIYINRIDSTFTNSTSLNDNLYPYFMDNTYDIDIDSAEDLEKARESLIFSSLVTILISKVGFYKPYQSIHDKYLYLALLQLSLHEIPPSLKMNHHNEKFLQK